MRPDGPRDPVAGPDDGPAAPFPLRLNGKVIKGFGRGSKEVSMEINSYESSRISSLYHNADQHIFKHPYFLASTYAKNDAG
jgi:hypothetical protein